MADQFAVVELMGRRRFGARVSECDQYGAKFLRAEILTPGEPVVQLVAPAALYAVTACTEAQARKVNTQWTLQSAVPMLPAEVGPGRDDAEDFEHCEECGVVCDAVPVKRDEDGNPFCAGCFEHLDDAPTTDTTPVVETASVGPPPGYEPVTEPGICHSCSMPLATGEGTMLGDWRMCREGCVPF